MFITESEVKGMGVYYRVKITGLKYKDAPLRNESNEPL